MSRLLIDRDYLRAIQSDNLEQVISSNSQIKLDVEQAAQSEMIGYLSQRYKTNEIFTNTTEFDDTILYNAKDLVYYTAPLFSASTVYTTDQRIVYNSKIYKSLAGSVAHPFAPSEWEYICENEAFFYVTLPADEYDLLVEYAIGDEVWYDNKVYTCATACVGIIPGATGSTAYWGAGVTYTTTNELPDDSTIWTAGDNRNQLIVTYLLDITLFHLHSRINPRNIPELRMVRYDGNSQNQTGGAIGWLRRVASGDVNADIPNIQPQQGMSIRWGSANDSNTQSPNYLW